MLERLLESFEGRSLMDVSEVSISSPIMLELLKLKGDERDSREEAHYQNLLKSTPSFKIHGYCSSESSELTLEQAMQLAVLHSKEPDKYYKYKRKSERKNLQLEQLRDAAKEHFVNPPKSSLDFSEWDEFTLSYAKEVLDAYGADQKRTFSTTERHWRCGVVRPREYSTTLNLCQEVMLPSPQDDSWWSGLDPKNKRFTMLSCTPPTERDMLLHSAERMSPVTNGVYPYWPERIFLSEAPKKTKGKGEKDD